jgi:hypothetical protein
VPHNDLISSERLDGRYSVGAEKSLKAIQRALAFEHQVRARPGAAWLWTVVGMPFRVGRIPKPMHYPVTLDNRCYVNQIQKRPLHARV